MSETHSPVIPPIAYSTQAEIDAFNKILAGLTRLEWRDANGRLVARPLALTLTLAKRIRGGETSIIVPAEDCLGVLGWETDQ